MKISSIFTRKREVSESDNAVDTKKQIIETLISRFRQLRFDSGGVRITKLTIWVADPVYISLLKNETFVEQLHTEIENNLIEALNETEITVKMGKPAPKVQPGNVVDDAVWFSFIMQEGGESRGERRGERGESDVRVAKINVVAGRGSLKKRVYELDPGKRTLYHIGRGDFEQNRSRPGRKNHIVIDDSEKDSNLLELNRHVSASHADILYREGHYYLRATRYGCRPEGSKTAVIRERAEGADEYELRDSDSLFRLKEGDLIELGDSVMLQFSQDS